ncbi:MAG: multidrug transporter [Psychroserpens sp.]|nr:multidrug transporter [Psychroserpens sp.]
MKTKLIYLLAFTLVFMGCESDDTAEVVINITNGGNNNNSGAIELSGIFTEDLTLSNAEEYVVTGPVIMSDGANLIIPAGMTLPVKPVGVNAYIAIRPGSKIIADGTAANPIVLTSDAATPSSGDWGGLIICGSAPINSTPNGSTETSTTEVGGLQYGGNNPSDDSGVLNYVRIEYSGGAIDGSSELNGLSLYAVGDQTQITYLQIFEGSDDGVEFFGGTVNASFVSVVNSEDDSIDWTEGYTGSLTNVYIKLGDSHDKAFECDGYNTDFSNAGGYFSGPSVTNVTIVGANDGGEAVRLRAGTQGIFTNVVIMDFEEGFDLDGDSGDNPTGQGVLDGLLQAVDVTFDNVIDEVKNDTGFTWDDADFLSGVGNGTGTDYATWGAGWTVGN